MRRGIGRGTDGRRLTKAVATGIAAFVGLATLVVPAIPSWAQPAPGTQTGAAVATTGWWNRANDAPPPPPPLPPNLPQLPPPPNVPAGTLAVGAVAGEPDKVTAIDIQTGAAPGATVTTFFLVLKEAPEPGANLNSAQAAIQACPITSGFWSGGENGLWSTAPQPDCSLASADGTRNPDGTWVFDLATIGNLWTSGSVAPAGVLLLEKADPPSAFQVVVDGPARNGIGVEFAATGGTDGTGVDGGLSGSGSTSGFGASGGSGGSGGSTGSFATGDPAPAPPPADTTATTAPPSDEESSEEAVDVQPARARRLPIFGNLPLATVALLPLGLGLGYLLMLVLGPAGDPGQATRRGGVSRALRLNVRRAS